MTLKAKLRQNWNNEKSILRKKSNQDKYHRAIFIIINNHLETTREHLYSNYYIKCGNYDKLRHNYDKVNITR